VWFFSGSFFLFSAKILLLISNLFSQWLTKKLIEFQFSWANYFSSFIARAVFFIFIWFFCWVLSLVFMASNQKDLIWLEFFLGCFQRGRLFIVSASLGSCYRFLLTFCVFLWCLAFSFDFFLKISALFFNIWVFNFW